MIQLQHELAEATDEKSRMSEILLVQARSIDSMMNELSNFQKHAGEIFDGISIDSEDETLKSEKERLMAEKDKLNHMCNELMAKLEAQKVEVRK